MSENQWVLLWEEKVFQLVGPGDKIRASPKSEWYFWDSKQDKWFEISEQIYSNPVPIYFM